VQRVLWKRDLSETKAFVMLETMELKPSVFIELRPTNVAFLIGKRSPIRPCESGHVQPRGAALRQPDGNARYAQANQLSLVPPVPPPVLA
jgi:hypothetical protein